MWARSGAILGRDLDTLTRFYGDLLGGKVDVDTPQPYGMVDTGADGGIPGGIYAPGGSGHDRRMP
jgi:predicted enzyme related to lactoylglutathione lyase